MKLWFVEPKPHVFVSGIKDSVADEVIQYLQKSCPPESGLWVFQRISQAPGYRIWGAGDPQRRVALIDGLQLVVEKDLPQQAP